MNSIANNPLPVVHQHIAVTRLSVSHVLDCLVGVFHRSFLNPGLQLFVGSQLQHLAKIAGGTDERATQLHASHDQDVRRDSQGAVFRIAQLDESAASLQEGNVLC